MGGACSPTGPLSRGLTPIYRPAPGRSACHLAEAARILAASLRHEPSLALGQGPQREHSQRERSLGALYADVRREYAGYLSATGALEAADRQLQRAKELDRIARTDR